MVPQDNLLVTTVSLVEIIFSKTVYTLWIF